MRHCATALVGISFLWSCSLEKSPKKPDLTANTAAVSTTAGNATAKASCLSSAGLVDTTINYTDKIKAIVANNCLSCHAAGAQEPDLSTYKALVAVAALSVTDIKSARMPLGSPLNAADAAMFFAWVNSGSPETAAAASAAAAAAPAPTAPAAAPNGAAPTAVTPVPTGSSQPIIVSPGMPTVTPASSCPTAASVPSQPAPAAPEPSAPATGPAPTPATPAAPPPAPIPAPVPAPAPLPAGVSVTGKPTFATSPNKFTEIDSPNGAFSFVIQDDGNLVEYQGKVPVWASRSYGIGTGPYTAAIQSDGNLVVQSGNGTPIYDTKTYNKGTPPFVLSIDNTGNVQIIDSTNKSIFSTGTFATP